VVRYTGYRHANVSHRIRLGSDAGWIRLDVSLECGKGLIRPASMLSDDGIYPCRFASWRRHRVRFPPLAVGLAPFDLVRLGSRRH
jgi:hypothetical protein